MGPALVGGDVSIEGVVDQGFGIFVRYRRCTAAALPKSGTPQAIDTAITEMVPIGCRDKHPVCPPAQAGNVAIVLWGFGVVGSLAGHAHAEGVG